MKYLVFDASNILYKTFYVHKTDDDITLAGLASHTALTTMNKYYKQFKPDKVVMCFDRHSWRKDYTAAEHCLSQKPYKGNRRQNMTPKEKARYELFLQHVNDFEQLIDVHTSIVVLAEKGLEADDLMAGIVQTVSYKEKELNPEFILVSADKDMIQLLEYKNVRLIDPSTGKDRTLEEWNNDAKLFMFEKCIRGDAGDNVQSAFPRCRKTRILKAYDDPFERANLMMECWVDQNGKDQQVKHMFKENMLLMDLHSQPKEIQKRTIETVLHGLENPGSFSYFHFLKFLGDFQMKKVAEQIDNYINLLSS